MGTNFYSQTLNFNADGETDNRRNAAGCVKPSPCRNGNMAKPNSDEDTCDEYPYASVVEGGSGSILRCTATNENSGEGGKVGAFIRNTCHNQPCQFEVTFGNPDGGRT